MKPAFARNELVTAIRARPYEKWFEHSVPLDAGDEVIEIAEVVPRLVAVG
jgi:hypothetical protein